MEIRWMLVLQMINFVGNDWKCCPLGLHISILGNSLLSPSFESMPGSGKGSPLYVWFLNGLESNGKLSHGEWAAAKLKVLRDLMRSRGTFCILIKVWIINIRLFWKTKHWCVLDNLNMVVLSSSMKKTFKNIHSFYILF